MDSQTKINPSSINSTSKIDNIHSMPWLKQADSSLQNAKIQRAQGKVGKIMSTKKTDEDYFPGTREEKKGKKKRAKKAKSVLTLDNLEDLVISKEQQDEKTVIADSNLKETPKPDLIYVKKRDEITPSINTSITNATVWSLTTNTADKLFPNVQSVVIDRLEEEEMLSHAIAESIATVQLEQFKKPSPKREDRWESLYGDKDDESGWDNVRRNLPPEAETLSSGDDTSGQKKTYDDNNNSSKSGILRNKRKDLSIFSKEYDEMAFRFNKCSETLENEVGTVRSHLTVSFNESIDVKIRSDESSDDESHNILNRSSSEPNIDKYGRVDGYSERRLFMGKGARMREQEYIQNRCSLGTGDTRYKNSESNSKEVASIDTQKSAVITPLCPINSLSQEPIPNLKEPETEKAIGMKNGNKTSETRSQKSGSNSQATEIVETEKPANTITRYPKNSQSQKGIAANNVHETPETPKDIKAIGMKNGNKTSETRYQKSGSNLQATEIVGTEKPANTITQYPNNSQSQKGIAAENVHETPEAPKDIKHTGGNVGHLNESMIKSPLDKPSSKSIIPSKNSAIDRTTDSSIRDLSAARPKSETSKTVESKPKESAMHASKRTRNIETCYNVAPHTRNGTRTKNEKINHPKNKRATSQIIDSCHGKSGKMQAIRNENYNPSHRAKIVETKDVMKDLQGNNEDEDIMSENLATVLRINENIYDRQNLEKELKSESQCLVSTLVGQDGYMPNFSLTDLQSTDSIVPTSDAKSHIAAHQQNLLLAGVSYFDTNCDDAQSLNDQNLPVDNSPNLNCNAYPTLPDYINGMNKSQMVQMEYALFMHRLAMQNMPYQSDGFSVDPDLSNVQNFTQSKGNIATSKSIEDSGPMINYNRERSLMGQAPPGLIKKLQLPPGFTRKREYTQRYDTHQNNPAIDSPACGNQSVEDVEPEKGEFYEKRSVQRNANNYLERTSDHFAQNKPPEHHGNSPRENTVQARYSSAKQQKYYYKSQNGFEYRQSQSTGNRKSPYPILGAVQNPYNECNNLKTDHTKSRQRPEFVKGTFIVQSSSKPSKESSPQNNNNYYLTSSVPRTTSVVDPQEKNNPLQNSNDISQPVSPAMSQIPEGTGNWRYNVNCMNPTQVPVNFIPNYPTPAQNAHHFPVDVSPSYFQTPIYQNASFQQLPMHMLSSVQMPMYPIQHVFNTEENAAQNVRLEEIKSPGMNFVSSDDPCVGMVHGNISQFGAQQPIIRAQSSADYNLNRTPVGQFGSNSNFYEPKYTMPNIRDTQNLHNDQTNGTTGLMYDNMNVCSGRGRGRLLKKNFF